MYSFKVRCPAFSLPLRDWRGLIVAFTDKIKLEAEYYELLGGHEDFKRSDCQVRLQARSNNCGVNDCYS
jgi:hypothetical protein